MPVQIPTLKKIAPAETASVGRLTAKAPDVASAFETTSGAAQRLASGVVQVVDKFETEAAQSEAVKRDLEMEAWGAQRLGGLREQQGDPTELYNQFDKELQQKFSDLANDETLGVRAKEMINQRLTNTTNRLYMQRLNQGAAQKSKYDENIKEAAVQMKSNALNEAANFIDPNDPSSFALFDDLVGEIRKLNYDHGKTIGTVTPVGDDEEGNAFEAGEGGKLQKLRVNPSAQMETAEKLSKGISTVMQNLINSGNIDKAEALKKKYWDFIDPVRQAKISDDFKKEEETNLAYRAARNPKVLNDIKDPVKRDKVKDAADKIVNDRQRVAEDRKDRWQKRNYQSAAEEVLRLQEDGTPLLTETEFFENPKIKLLRANGGITPEGIQKLKGTFLVPKRSADQALVKMNDLIVQRDPDHPDGLRGMTQEDLLKYKAELGQTDRNALDRKWREVNDPATGAEMQRAYSNSEKQLLGALDRQGIIQRDGYNTSKPAAHNYDKFTDLRRQYIEAMGEDLGRLNPKEQEEEADRFARSVKNKEIFKPVERRKVISKAPSLPDEKQTPQPKGKSRMQYAEEYRKKNGSYPTTAQLDVFIKGQ